MNSGLLRRSLRLFLPISGAITLVLLPMVALYEQSRRETLEGRVSALVQAATVRAQITLQEARANTGVITTVPELQDLLRSTRPSIDERRRMEAVFRAQLREYERLSGLVVYGPDGQPVATLNWPGVNLPEPLRRRALTQAEALQPGQIWVSSVQWPSKRAAELLMARPLFLNGEQRRGVLLAVVSLAPLARDFNRITNEQSALERGFLLSGDGRTINPLPGAAAGLNFAARYPEVWQHIQREARGVVDTGHGLFVYLTDTLRPTAQRGSGEGLFVFDRGISQPHLAVVIQIPPKSLYLTSAFAHPVGQALVALLYLVAAGSSLGIARYQLHLEKGRELERQLQARLRAIVQSAGVGMCLCDVQTGRFVTVNEALCGFFGLSEPDLLTRTWQELTHPEDLGSDQALAAQLQHGELNSYRLRKRFLRSDGESIWGDLVVSCTRNADGTLRDLIGQISDVSELVAKTAYLEAASDAGVVGVWDWDVPRDVLTWDSVMYRLYGWRAEDFHGTREAWEKAVHPEDKPFVVQELQAALSGWREYQPRFRVIWPDGSIHHIQARSRTTYGADGAPLRMIGVNYDITEQVERQQDVEQQRQLLVTTFDALVDPLLVLTLENRGQSPFGSGWKDLFIAEVNPAAATFFRRSPPQLVGQPLASALPQTHNKALIDALQGVAAGGPFLTADAQPLQLVDGADPVLVDLRAVAVRRGLVINFRDVTEQRLAARQLAESEERYRLLAENASDVVFRATSSGVTEWITDSVTPLVGWTPAELMDHPFAQFVHPEDQGIFEDGVSDLAHGGRHRFRIRVLCRDGNDRWISISARALTSDDGNDLGIVGSWRDAQAEVEAERELDRRARIDPLTRLYNRQEILEQLEHLSQSLGHPSQRHGDAEHVAVLFCDIDHFKDINDTHGHSGGDQVLQTLGQRLRSGTRSGDLVGRLGGDEVLVVLQGVPSLEVALVIANKLHAAARDPLQLPTGAVNLTLSIGVTLIKPHESVQDVVARADHAMYEAKQGGRDRVVAFT